MAASTDMRVQPRLMELAHPASLRFSEKPDPRARQPTYQVVQGIHELAELQGRHGVKPRFQAFRTVSCGQATPWSRLQVHLHDDWGLAAELSLHLHGPSGPCIGMKRGIPKKSK